MSSDGQISVSVNAEGTEDAVGQLGDNAVAEQQAAGDQAAGEVQQVEAIPGGDGGDGGAGGGKGKLGSLLKKLLALVAFLGPILKVLGVVSNVLEAFVAPLAILLLRLLQPVLVALLTVLPIWFDIFDVLAFIVDLSKEIGVGIAKATGILDLIEGVLTTVESGLSSLPTDLASKIADQIPGVDTGAGELSPQERRAGETGLAAAQQVTEGLGATPFVPQPVSIAISGGLNALIDRVERDPNKNV